ncbi:MAG: prepilin-type N-terminal cleavage/methylation domain-containing protein [Deltaproteobacteria bacterium]|nr:prepilin-type N-terminal cleavage/methylation domain-containing protein [Deltaproteobacteria bacterium]
MHDNSGFTLLELLISIVILSIIMIGLHQAMATALSAHRQTTDRQELLARARYAMERMVMFVQETDQMEIPAADNLVLNERVLDTYDNVTQGYRAQGDGYLDADNDHDGLVNEGGVNDDPVDPISFSLDKSEPNNWKLQEQMPDYSTSTLDDSLATKVLCEHVTTFSCSLLAPNLVEIQLTVSDGENEMNLKTRVKAIHME